MPLKVFKALYVEYRKLQIIEQQTYLVINELIRLFGC